MLVNIPFKNYSKTLEIEMYGTTFPAVLHVCETWFLIFRKKHNLQVCVNKMLEEINWAAVVTYYIMRYFTIYAGHLMLLGQ
jgi:hypothetical protein